MEHSLRLSWGLAWSIALLLAGIALCTAGAEVARWCLSWPLNPECAPPVVGLGERVVIKLPSHIDTVNGLWKGDAKVRVVPPSDLDRRHSLSVYTQNDQWGKEIPRARPGKEQLWVSVVMPPSQPADGVLDLDINLHVVYPKPGRQVVFFSEGHKYCHHRIRVAVSPVPNAGVFFTVIWWACMVCGVGLGAYGFFRTIDTLRGVGRPQSGAIACKTEGPSSHVQGDHGPVRPAPLAHTSAVSCFPEDSTTPGMSPWQRLWYRFPHKLWQPFFSKWWVRVLCVLCPIVFVLFHLLFFFPSWGLTLLRLWSLRRKAARLCSECQFDEAVLVARRRQVLSRRVLEKLHPRHYTGLSELAALYELTGVYAAAEELYREAVDCRRAVLGTGHPEFGVSLDRLGAVLTALGNYAEAEAVLREASRRIRAACGEQHPQFGTVLRHLGSLYLATGSPGEAEPFVRQAAEVHKAALGEGHPEYALSLSALASWHVAAGNYPQAEDLQRRALAVLHETWGRRHPEYARCLERLAAIRTAQGEWGEAESLLRQALAVLQSLFGRSHPACGSCLAALGALYSRRGDYASAEVALRQAMDITRTLLGEYHPEHARGLCDLADLCAATGREAIALALLRRAACLHDRCAGQAFALGAESRRLALLETIREASYQFLSLVVLRLSASADAVRAGLDLVLRRKALAAEMMATQRDVAAKLSGRYPALRPGMRALAELQREIAERTLAGPGEEGPQAHEEQLAAQNARKEQLEAQLARQIPKVQLEQKLRQAGLEAVADALPSGSALAEFVCFPVRAAGTVSAPDRGPRPYRYAVFLLPAAEPGNVRVIDLGDAAPIDGLIAAFCAGVTGDAELRDLARVSLEPTADATAGDRLRAAVFDPLADALGGCRRLFLAPDGDLSRLPFEALPLADGRHLLDTYRLSYVGVGRDLLRFPFCSDRPPAGPLVAADPDFDLAREAVAPASTPPVARRLSRDLDRSRCHFTRLPGTRAEGERIARRLGVQPLLDGAALEGRLKACRSPRLLHLATHGFFLPDQPRDLERLGRDLKLMGVGETPGLGRLSGPGMEDPMLRSGLALAGANTFLKGAAPPPEAEDGLLTAADVAGLDLLDTELVVLSACETGLGAVHAGEGVFGLRRAFTVAGAKTLVMSLWKVPDLATAFLMDRFYDNLLTRGLDRDLALSEAQRATRDATVGQLRREWLTPTAIEQFAVGSADARRHLEHLAGQADDHRPFASPFYWGAFICQGDPAPLPAANRADG
jgi:CHAT domain-containing protein/tetratricopeptide (TPR) repeat protein